MSEIYVKDHDGNIHLIEATEGLTLMELVRDAGLDIEAACGGCCACATCHVYVDSNWQDKMPNMKDDEESMLDQAFNVKSESRLGCQIEYNDSFNGLKLTLPPK